jgi:hypothetical protein
MGPMARPNPGRQDNTYLTALRGTQGIAVEVIPFVLSLVPWRKPHAD